MTQTNAQAALQAAATVYGMTDGQVNPDTITGMAYKFKGWLDRKDEADKPAPEPEVSHHISCNSRRRGAPEGLCNCVPLPYEQAAAALAPEPEVIHHIACGSRRGAKCNCVPVPYDEVKNWPTGEPTARGGVIEPAPRPGPTHFLSQDHNGDPVCHCGWNPKGLVLTREAARNEIRLHVASQKPRFYTSPGQLAFPQEFGQPGDPDL